MNKIYPDDYDGPRSGESEQADWAKVRWLDAFKYIRNDVWSYMDFDNYIGSLIEENRQNAAKSEKEYGIMLSQIGVFVEEYLPSDKSTVLEGVLVLLSRYLTLQQLEVENALEREANKQKT